jgi:two-component system, NarL family, nitrate/nitrite response regulator NarL
VTDRTPGCRRCEAAPLRDSAPATAVLSQRGLFTDLLAAALPVVARIEPSAQREPQTPLPADVQVLVIDGELRSDDELVADLCHRAARQGVGVLVVGATRERHELALWVERGVGGFVDESSTVDELREMATQLAVGQTVIGVSVRESLLSELRSTRARSQDRFAAFESLTKRESDVLRLLAIGSSPEDVAKSSFVSVNTVRTQIRGVLAKLDVSSVVSAVALAYRTGWLDADLAR